VTEMREYLSYFMENINFPGEAVETFLDVHDSLVSDTVHKKEMDSIITKYYCDEGYKRINEVLEDLTRLAQKMDINPYTMHLMFYLYCSKILKNKYKTSDVSMDVFWNSMLDLSYKLWECRNIHGVWGTFVANWLSDYFVMERFGLGRMQYEAIPFPYDRYTKNGYTVKKGDRVYNMHIPSSGPLTREKRIDSYKRAYDFFKHELNGGPIVMVCHSWLLYPDNEKFYPKGSNIIDFMHDFEIIHSVDEDKFSEAWRVFGRHHDKDMEEWPTDTSLQRAYIDWLKAGNKTGAGFGVLIFDGQKIL
jgi:hypothetical protein